VISTPNSFNITLENQIIFARIENDICYEIYQIILIPENCDIIIPDGISPNGDGFNDLFEIQNLYGVHLNHTLKIFNRYGVCVFNGDNNLKWDGTSDDGDLVPVGTYFYVLNLNNDEEKSVFTGWVYCNY
jgi:gliding motility-associated-like protein